ncbi:hypothetical protein QE152_g24546 [Popillia japonica]|uniref:Uncharacterized protein n=1 Tax=Popillia japonica TaxID=7064 RepID=A0AAW1KF88_POPJA
MTRTARIDFKGIVHYRAFYTRSIMVWRICSFQRRGPTETGFKLQAVVYEALIANGAVYQRYSTCAPSYPRPDVLYFASDVLPEPPSTGEAEICK